MRIPKLFVDGFLPTSHNSVAMTEAISKEPSDAIASERERLSRDTVREQWIHPIIPFGFQLGAWSFAVVNAVSSLAARTDKFDDGLQLIHGVLVQQGRTPNLDFYSFYPPLGLYVDGALFSLLGRSIIAIRLLGAVLFFLILLLVARLFKRRFPFAHPILPLVILLVAAAIGNALWEPQWSGFAVSILALLTYLSSPNGNLWAVGLSGVLTGFALLYRINFGAYVVMVVAADLSACWLARGVALRDRFRLKGDLLTAAAFLVPLSIVSASFCLGIYGRHAVGTVVELIIHAQRLMKLRGFIELSASSEIVLAVSLPAAWFFLRMLVGSERISLKAFVPAIVAVIILAITMAGRNHVSIILIVSAAEIGAVISLNLFVHRLDRAEFCLLLFYCGLLHYYLSRADWYHWRLLPVGVGLLFPFLVLASSSPDSAQATSPVANGTALAALLTFASICLVLNETRPAVEYIPNGFRLLADVAAHPHMSDTDRLLGPKPPSREWLSVYDDEDELQAVRYLRTRSKPDEAIFVGVPDHSRIYVNNLRFYFLADRPIGVHAFQLETRVATEAPVQQAIIHDLDQNNVKWVILDGTKWTPDKAFLAHPYVGSKLLDQYIASHYREEAEVGAYSILSRWDPHFSGK
jgi:hypothetical protein